MTAQVARVEVEMLHAVLLIEVVEHLGGGAEIIDQLAARDAGLLASLALAEAVAQRLAIVIDQHQQPALVHMS